MYSIQIWVKGALRNEAGDLQRMADWHTVREFCTEASAIKIVHDLIGLFQLRLLKDGKHIPLPAHW